MTQPSPEAVERMMAHFRAVVAKYAHVKDDGGAMNPELEEARAIVAMLPEPVDPDLIEAREIAASECRKVGATAAAEQIETSIAAPETIGDHFNKSNAAIVGAALAAIKRGRALAESGK